MARVVLGDFAKFVIDESHSNHFGVVDNAEPEPLGWGVYVTERQMFFTHDKAEAEYIARGVTHLNRWASMHNPTVRVKETRHQSAVSNKYHIGWTCTWQVGHMGWDAIPMFNAKEISEAVSHSDRRSKSAVVLAPTALLAIERSKLATTSNAHILRTYEGLDR